MESFFRYRCTIYLLNNDEQYYVWHRMLCKRTLSHTFLRIAGASLGDRIALFQTFGELICSDLADRHDVELGSEAVIAIRIGKHITGSPLTGDGIQRNVLEAASINIDHSGVCFLQCAHRI